MRKLLAILLFTIELLNAANTKDVCFTVQLLSKPYTQENETLLKEEHYPQECTTMHIGSTLTVRCGCVETEQEVEKISQELNQKFSDTLITRTYKYRFNREEEQAPIVEVVSTPIVVVSNQPSSLEKKSDKKKREEKSKKKHKKKHKKKLKKKHKKSKEKVVNIAKSKKNVYTNYSKYLRVLKSSHGYGKYDYRYKFGAQFQYDIGYVNEANSDYGDSRVRKLRLYHKGSFLDKQFFYEMEYSFLNEEYKDVYVGFKDKFLKTNFRVRLGNIKEPYSLEQYSSSKYSTFMENSLNDAFYIDRKLGLELLVHNKFDHEYITAYASLFSNSIDERLDNETNHNGGVVRAVYAHKFKKNHLVTFGASYMQENFDEENIKFSQRSESKFNREKYISEKIKNVDVLSRKNIELYYQYFEYVLQAEASEVELDARKGLYRFQSYYLQGSYFLYGSLNKYKLSEATLSKVKVYKGGAVELASRYSYLDLKDGGEQEDYNFGVNYYFNNEIRFMLNYIISKPTNTENYDGLLQLIQARVQIAF